MNGFMPYLIVCVCSSSGKALALISELTLRWAQLLFTSMGDCKQAPRPELAGGRPGAYGLWSSNLVVTEFCLSKIVPFYLFSLYGICFVQFYIDIVVFVVWKYSGCFNILY